MRWRLNEQIKENAMKVALWTILVMLNGFGLFITLKDETIPYVLNETTTQDIINFFSFALLAILFCVLASKMFTTDTGKKNRIWIGIGMLICVNVAMAVFKDMSHVTGIVFGIVVACIYIIGIKRKLIRRIESLAMRYEFAADKQVAFANYLQSLRKLVALGAAERIWVNVCGYVIKLSDLPMVTEAMRAIWDRRVDVAQNLCRQIHIEAQQRPMTDPLNVDLVSLLQAMVNCEGMLNSQPSALLPKKYRDQHNIKSVVSQAVSSELGVQGSMHKPQAIRSLLSALIIDGCFAKLWNNASSAFPPISERKVNYEMMGVTLSDNGLLTLYRKRNTKLSIIPTLLSVIMLCIGIVVMLLEPVLRFFIAYAGGTAQAQSVLQGYNLWMMSFIIILVLSTLLCFMHSTRANIRRGLEPEFYVYASMAAFFSRGFSFIAAFILLIAPGELIKDYIDLRQDIQQIKNNELICKDVIIGSRRFPSKGAIYFLSDARVLDSMKVFSNHDHRLYQFHVYLPHDMKVDIKDDDRFNNKKPAVHNWMLKPHYEVCFTSNTRTVKHIAKKPGRIHLL